MVTVTVVVVVLIWTVPVTVSVTVTVTVTVTATLTVTVISQATGAKASLVRWARGVTATHYDSILDGGQGGGWQFKMAEKLLLNKVRTPSAHTHNSQPLPSPPPRSTPS